MYIDYNHTYTKEIEEIEYQAGLQEWLDSRKFDMQCQNQERCHKRKSVVYRFPCIEIVIRPILEKQPKSFETEEVSTKHV